MPEYPESIVSQLLIQHWLKTQLEKDDPEALKVLNIWIDATKKEADRAPEGSPANLGHVFIIDSECEAIRGQKDTQRPIYPSMFKGEQRTLQALGVHLRGTDFAAWNVIMDLGSIWVQVSVIWCNLSVI